MVKYRKILKFTFKNKYYQLLLDNHDKYFFLGVNKDNTYSYITIEELFELEKVFCHYPLTMKAIRDNKKSKIKLVPKVFIGGVLTTLTLTTLLTGCMNYGVDDVFKLMNVDTDRTTSRYEEVYTAPKSENQISFTLEDDKDNTSQLPFIVEDGNEKIEVETYLESDWLNYIYIYDMNYLNKVLDYDNVSIEQIHKTIDGNKKISDRFVPILHEYVNALNEKHPDAELRVLYENLKTLEIIECDKQELMLASLSVDSYGCYIRTENKIYVSEDYEYKKGTWEYQVIFHELSHVLRTGFWDTKNKQIRVQCEGLTMSGITTAEALNSIFAVSLFDYEERDIAYQLQSNYHSLMIECMDNYKLSDYVNHSLTYYASKLDEHNNDVNYAKTIFELIETQYKDYHSEHLNIEEKEYYPIYNYISKMYFNKHITPNTSYDDAKLIVDELVERVMFDVPDEYHIDTNEFYNIFQNYCDEHGIEKSMNR
ncbi:MAG: hypothetical protein GX758_02925 [Tenericutes bacterium]|nr:hypothetical protein [Mycoplasmatota bacterium]